MLAALINLLLLPPASPGPDKCYLVSLLAAIAQHGPLSREHFTALLVQSRGALGVVVSLLPEPLSRPMSSKEPGTPGMRNRISGTPAVGEAGSVSLPGVPHLL